MTSPRPVSGNAVVLAATVLVVVLVGAVVALGIAIDDGARVASLVGLVLPVVGVAVPALLALAKIHNVADQVDKVEQRTLDLTNGHMDRKIRAAVADVLRPGLIDPQAKDQLVVDRASRDHVTD